MDIYFINQIYYCLPEIMEIQPMNNLLNAGSKRTVISEVDVAAIEIRRFILHVALDIPCG